MYDPNPWKVCRSLNNKNKYAVCLFERVTTFDARIKETFPIEFDTLKSAQKMAESMNILRRGVRNVQ